MDRNDLIGIAGPRILNSNGTRQFSARSFPTWTIAFSHRHSLLTKMFPANPLTSKYLRSDLDGRPTEIDWVSGCCMLVRKKVFEVIGGFDEGYFLFFEDVDFAYRAKKSGSRCVYYPDLQFSHSTGASRAHLPDKGIEAHHSSAER